MKWRALVRGGGGRLLRLWTGQIKALEMNLKWEDEVGIVKPVPGMYIILLFVALASNFLS